MACPSDQKDHPVSRTEIIDHVAAAFATGRATRSDLVEVAARSGARDELLAVLQTLPEGRYPRPQDLWTVLAYLPVEV